MADTKPVSLTPLPPEILACRCLAAVIIIPLFIPILHKPLRRLLRPGVSPMPANSVSLSCIFLSFTSQNSAHKPLNRCVQDNGRA